MKAYVIFQAEILDTNQYEKYKEAVAPTIAAAGGRYLIRGGDPILLEGYSTGLRTVILEFPSRSVALTWFNSEEYAAIKLLRLSAARATVQLVDEYE